VKNEYNEIDFSNGVKNPYFDKMNKKIEISLRNEDYELFNIIGDQNNVTAEIIIRRCLIDYANKLRESDAKDDFTGSNNNNLVAEKSISYNS